MSRKRDIDFLALAKFWAQRKSKDPSTQCCAVVVRPDGTVASMGYNGFPMGVLDCPEHLNDRDQKYPRTIHAEVNALSLVHEPLHGYTLYQWPGRSCAPCAAVIIQHGIIRVVNPLLETHQRAWAVSQEIGLEMFQQVGIEYSPLEFDE